MTAVKPTMNESKEANNERRQKSLKSMIAEKPTMNDDGEGYNK